MENRKKKTGNTKWKEIGRALIYIWFVGAVMGIVCFVWDIESSPCFFYLGSFFRFKLGAVF